MKSRSDITSELYLSKELSSALNKMKPIELRDDLKQEMFICLCGLNDEKFWSIYNNNGLPGLKFWLVRVMLNMIHSTKSNQSVHSLKQTSTHWNEQETNALRSKTKNNYSKQYWSCRD
jgi:hypothetical protein